MYFFCELQRENKTNPNNNATGATQTQITPETINIFHHQTVWKDNCI